MQAILYLQAFAYIGDVSEDDDSEDEDYYFDYDRDTANLVYEMKYTLEKLANTSG